MPSVLLKILLIGMLLLGAAAAAFGVDALIAWIFRDLAGATFGFPKKFRASAALDDKTRWTWLLTCRVGGTVTNRLFSAATDDGLAFAMLSPFKNLMMHTVVVPWKNLKLESERDLLGNPYEVICVCDDDGSTISTVGPLGNGDPRWITTVRNRIENSEGAIASIRS